MERNELNKQWHQGFYCAAHLEFKADRENLDFKEEEYLSHEPIRMDLLIIKKLKDIPIQNEIGHIFRKYNVCEYKSPDDELCIDDLYKTIGYACLYKGLGDTVNAIPAEDITITLVRQRYPRELINTLRNIGCTIKEYVKGVYYIEGNLLFPVQIIVTGKLDKKHQWLKVLAVNVKEADVLNFAKATNVALEQGDRNYVDAIYQISVMANRDTYEDIKRRYSNMCEELRMLMKPELDEARLEGKLEGRLEGRLEGIERGKQELVDIIKKVKEGVSDAVLYSAGYSKEDVSIARALFMQ